jgi:transcriptional regulator with XRE-family HTH domain
MNDDTVTQYPKHRKRRRKSIPFLPIGRRLTKMRETVCPNQAELCRTIGIEPNRWNQYEKGTRRIPPDIAVKVNEQYGVTTDWIYCGDRSGLSVQLNKLLPQ